eukprot:295763_1
MKHSNKQPIVVKSFQACNNPCYTDVIHLYGMICLALVYIPISYADIILALHCFMERNARTNTGHDTHDLVIALDSHTQISQNQLLFSNPKSHLKLKYGLF